MSRHRRHVISLPRVTHTLSATCVPGPSTPKKSFSASDTRIATIVRGHSPRPRRNFAVPDRSSSPSPPSPCRNHANRCAQLCDAPIPHLKPRRLPESPPRLVPKAPYSDPVRHLDADGRPLRKHAANSCNCGSRVLSREVLKHAIRYGTRKRSARNGRCLHPRDPQEPHPMGCGKSLGTH